MLVAAFDHLAGKYTHSAEAHAALDPWLAVPIDWNNVRGKAKEVVCIFSDNDDYVPVSNVAVFQEKIGAKTILLHNRNHFSGNDGITELPEALEAILHIV